MPIVSQIRVKYYDEIDEAKEI
jgi:hypothetical protein